MSPLLTVYSWAIWFWFSSRAWQLWNRLYQAFDKPREPLHRFPNIQKQATYLTKLLWQADGPRQMWDACAHPEAFQFQAELYLSGATKKGPGDCEDFGVYGARVMRNEILHDPYWASIFFGCQIRNTWLLSVQWMGADGFDGHGVNLIELCDGTYRYADYGLPFASQPSIKGIANQVVNAFRGNTLLAYTVIDPVTLAPVQVTLP